MTLKRTPEYEADQAARRLISRMHSNVQDLTTKIDTMLTAVNSMRLALGQATLSLAEVEALQIKQAAEKRINDAALYDLQSRLADMLAEATLRAGGILTAVQDQTTKVGGLATQAARMAETTVEGDNELIGPVPGLEYVDLDWIAKELGCSKRNVNYHIQQGNFPGGDAIDPDGGGKHKQLWLKHSAKVAVHRMLNKDNKKGIAALV